MLPIGATRSRSTNGEERPKLRALSLWGFGLGPRKTETCSHPLVPPLSKRGRWCLTCSPDNGFHFSKKAGMQLWK